MVAKKVGVQTISLADAKAHLTQSTPGQIQSTGEFMREQRSDARY